MEDISKILKLGDSKEKIKILETLDNTNNPEILEIIISTLDDKSIEVRGEAYSALMLNQNKISDFLINGLSNESVNMKSSILLILANRNEISAIPEIIKLVKDKNSIVRSCVIGALKHLNAREAKNIFLESLSDSNIEVRKNALQAIIDLKITISENIIKKNFKEKDSEIEKILATIKKISGPEGI